MKRLFILLALLTFMVVSSNAQSLHEGDVNGDGNVNQCGDKFPNSCLGRK